MSDHTQRIERAIRVTPPGDRDRYEAEWRHDLAEAEANGLSPRDVEQGALRLAVGLRAQQIGRSFLGKAGVVRALGAWLILLGLLVLAVLLGGVMLLVAVLALAGFVVVLARVGTPSHVSHWLMVASIACGTVSGAFVWWVASVRIDAADAMGPEPAAAAWGGAALVVFALSAVTLVVSAVIATTREGRTHR